MKRGQSPWYDVAAIIPLDAQLVFDIGANTGQTAKQLAVSFPQADIYCFEPVLSTFRELAIETASLERVRRFPFGFSDRKSTQNLFLQLQSGWNSVTNNTDAGLGTIKVQLETIDAFCAANNVRHVDLLKTDTEGHDLNVLRGAQGMLSQGRVGAIYVEVGFYREDAGHTDFCAVLEYLKGVGFQFFGLYEQDSIVFVEHPTQPRFPWTNALFLQNELVRAKYGDEYVRWLAGLGLSQRDPAPK